MTKKTKIFGPKNVTSTAIATIFKSSNLLPSLTAKTWMVPWSLATQSKVESAEKLMQFTEAGWWGGGDGGDYLEFGHDDNWAQNF